MPWTMTAKPLPRRVLRGKRHETCSFPHRRIHCCKRPSPDCPIRSARDGAGLFDRFPHRAASRPVLCGQGRAPHGHDFVEQALSRGAAAAVVRRDQLARYLNPAGLLAVDDTLVALQTLATAVRKMWGKTSIGITGSMGKTTTKEAIAHLLAVKYRVHRSKGNFNNHFGLPLGLLTLEPEDDLAVIEMGMSHAGEIAALARIALPNQAVVTNVAPVHLESFESMAQIARAKYELIEAIPRGGLAVLNADDEYVRHFGRDFKGKVVRFGLKSTAGVSADVWAENIQPLGPEG